MIPITKITGRMGNQMFQFAYIYSQFKDGIIPDVYVQDFNYFDHHREEIKTLFGAEIVPNDYIAIHVRRGDYVNNPHYTDLASTDYYEKAMDEFPDEDFRIFSDDIKWCKQRFGMYTKNIRYSEGKDEITDFNLMAGAKGLIIANSSFSWWAGYLNNGKVVAPKSWSTLPSPPLLDNWISL